MKNFKEILLKNTIQIPIIQRDYAQGRKDSKVVQIREGFLNSIFDVLSENKPLHLDFIYGSIKNKKFIPLDGQQRLTTLFLLYWYFGKKQEIEIDFLTKFTYETRSSSREFCNKLVMCDIDFTKGTLSNQIKDSNWFLAYWNNDPSIKAMLVMLDAIHIKFTEHRFYENLDNITFNFFKLEDFGLDDDLYIKMNARGKSLTDFENFKAKFEKHLSKVDDDLQKEFSFKIDNNWTDFFWQFGVEDESFLIDDFFMNYFWYITEMLHYKTSKERLVNEKSFKKVIKIYSSKENITFLFKSLDKLEIIFSSFDNILTSNKYEIGKVCLFDNDINLLEKIIWNDPINIQQKILLFITINHIIDFDTNQALVDLLRVIRNLTTRIRHRKNGYFYYTGDLSNDHVNSILNIFLNRINIDIYKSIIDDEINRSNSGFNETSVKYEIVKATLIVNDKSTKEHLFELEDYTYLKGDIHNFISSDIEELKFNNIALREIYSKSDSLIIRSMLTVEDYSLKIGWTILGDKYFFGKNNNWETILTSSDSLDFYNKFLINYKDNNNSLENIIKSFFNENSDRNWIYYFVKYPEMTETIISLSKDNNLYAWYNDFALEKMGGSNLNAYHQNPFIRTVSKLLETQSYIIQFDEFSYMNFNKFKIYSTERGWKILNIDQNLYSEIIKKYPTELSENYFLLKGNETKDRIEILVEFLTETKKIKA